MSELDSLDPIPEQRTLSSGLTVVYQDLRSRQFFKLIRIITHGASPLLSDPNFFKLEGLESEEMGAKFIALALMAIPDAEDEAIDFVASMVKPAGLIERPGLNNQDKERNSVLWAGFYEELQNPDLEDLVTIIEDVVRRETDDLVALGKRLTGMFKLAQKTGQLPVSLEAPVLNFSADSVEPSTSSVPSTDGETSTSTTSLSDVSAKSLPLSPSDEASRPEQLVSS